jgi:hypothetical protein
MGFFDLFRPRWRHSNPEVRAEVVRQLTYEDLSILREVVLRDPDAKIRRQALKKLDDDALLEEVRRGDTDESLRQLATERLEVRLLESALGDDLAAGKVLSELSERALIEVARRGKQPSVRMAAAARLSSEKAIADVARSAEDQEIRIAAAARVTQPGLLKELALSDANRHVALDAVARLEDLKALESVAQKGKNKAVRTAAKEKLQQLRPQSEAKPKTKDSEKERSRSEEAAALRRVEEEARRAREEARRSREAGSRKEAERAQAERDRRAAEKAEKSAEAHRLEEEARRAQEKIQKEQEAKRQAARAFKEAELARRAVEEAQNRARLEQICNNLEALVESDDSKRLRQVVKDAEDVFYDSGRTGKSEALRERFQAARARLKIRLEELRQTDDWKRWSNVPQFEKLCARAEALLEGELTDGKQGAKQLKELQAEWKALGAPPKEKSEALWNRFKQSCDQLHERNRKQLSLLDEERGKNLQKKEELCQRVEAVADSDEWKETAETIKLLQEEWKAVGPVSKEVGDAVWQRFRGACDRFFERRKAHFAGADEARAKNLELYLRLCEQAEALRDSTAWREGADRLKALQAEWKTIGPAPKDRSDEIWQRFRGACDRFFERRKAHFAEADEEREANLKKKEELCVKVEWLADAGSTDDPDAKMRELMAEWKTIGPAPKDRSDQVWARFRTACDRLRGIDQVMEPLPESPSDSKFENKLPLEKIAQKLAPRSQNE